MLFRTPKAKVDTRASNALLDMLVVITFVENVKAHFVAVFGLDTALSLDRVTILGNLSVRC